MACTVTSEGGAKFWARARGMSGGMLVVVACGAMGPRMHREARPGGGTHLVLNVHEQGPERQHEADERHLERHEDALTHARLEHVIQPAGEAEVLRRRGRFSRH